MIGAFYIFALLAIGIGGDFPLNDDWSYAEGVRHLLIGDGLVMPTVCAAGIAHVGLGFISAKLLGYSYVSLRICSFVMTIVGAFAFYIAAASLRIPRGTATFLTILYAANPILLNVTFGFMSDSTALSLNMIFLACLLRGLEKRSFKLILVGFFVLSLAATVRQSALIFIVLSPICLSKRFENVRYRYFFCICAAAVPLMTALACDHWLTTRHLDASFSNDDYNLVRTAHSDTIRKILFSAREMFLPVVASVGHVLCYLSIFCLPAIPPLLVVIFRRGKLLQVSHKLVLAISLLIVTGSLAAVILSHATMPFAENIWRVTTLGAQGIIGIIREPIRPRARMILTAISFVLAVPLTVTLGWLIRLLFRNHNEWRVLVLASCVLTTIAFLTLETVVRCTDRYYLIALAPILLGLGYIANRSRINLVHPVSVVLLIMLAYYSICGNQEYLSSNRARWKAIDWLEARGVQASSVDGGYEYNTLRDITVYNSKYRGEPPLCNWRWWPIKGETYLVSLSPVPGYKSIHTEQYFSLLDRKTRDIEVLKKVVAGL